jgi:hypothetical protein
VPKCPDTQIFESAKSVPNLLPYPLFSKSISNLEKKGEGSGHPPFFPILKQYNLEQKNTTWRHVEASEQVIIPPEVFIKTMSDDESDVVNDIVITVVI